MSRRENQRKVVLAVPARKTAKGNDLRRAVVFERKDRSGYVHLLHISAHLGSFQSVSGRGAQSPVAIIGERLLDFLARVHDERTVLYHWLPQRLRCQQQEAYTFSCGLYAHVVAIGQDACRAMRQRLGHAGGTDLRTAFIGIQEGIVAPPDRGTEYPSGRPGNVEGKRIGGGG